jgi:hypothetical protein
MNYKRIVLGGLAGGALMIVLDMVASGALGLGKQWEEAVAALGKPMHVSGGLMAMFFINYFLRGVMLVWIYAAIRPRFGAGPATAIRAAFVFWIAMAVFPDIVNISFDLFPARTVVTMGIVALAEMIAGTMLGGWLYQEEAAGQSRRVAAG